MKRFGRPARGLWGCETTVFADNGAMARPAFIYSEYSAGGCLGAHGGEISGVRFHACLVGPRRARKESPMSSLGVGPITGRRSLRPDGPKPC